MKYFKLGIENYMLKPRKFKEFAWLKMFPKYWRQCSNFEKQFTIRKYEIFIYSLPTKIVYTGKILSTFRYILFVFLLFN